jgi:hypothetical protein
MNPTSRKGGSDSRVIAVRLAETAAAVKLELGQHPICGTSVSIGVGVVLRIDPLKKPS